MAQLVKAKGIFHGLPDYTDSGTKQSILVAGANGITGDYLVRHLNKYPERWSTVYALSRRAPAHPLGGNVKHLTIDLLDPPSKIARSLEEAGTM